MRKLSNSILRVMRAIRVHQFGGPEVLKYETDVPVPVPGPFQVLIKLHAAGINPVDTYIRSGTYSRTPTLPFIPGGDGAGIVEAVGSQVKKFKVGDRVFTIFAEGTYAEYTSNVEHLVFPLPDNVTFQGGASIGVPYFTAFRAIITKCHAEAKESILIHGASGGVGIAAVQLSKSLDLIVYGTAGSDEGLSLIKENGTDFTFNHSKTGYVDKIMTSTNNRGLDIIIEMLSNVNLGADLKLVADSGRIAIVGCRGTTEINPRLCMGKESSVFGVMLSKATPEEYLEMGKTIIKGLEKGSLKPIIHKVYSLDAASEAHIEIIQGESKKGKFIFDILK